ncbi:DUF3347 domain-containing protein [Roseiconus nitratireducens]|uniref:DUF3347 domain-containing protein n=1 Tax=Roseiconus nitratireducens TaxID=2605748 RepID=A0A5M6CX23_9BACT|nr:DUF3347 domain-containing protein [Roseiconus nitratireducens]
MRNFIREHRNKLWAVQSLLLVLLGFIAAWWIKPSESHTAVNSSKTEASALSKPTIWTCSMHPQIRRSGPGDCPICGMDLVPVKESAGGVRTISISNDVKKLMNVEVTPVVRKYVPAKVRMVGKISYDETRLAHITAWVPGRLERMFVDFTGIEVNEGDHMVEIYSEQLYTAQQELLAALDRDQPRPSSRFIEPLNLLESAREKLRRLGLTPEQIQEIEQRGTASETVTINSPVGGVVVQKLRQEGDRVQTGDRIYSVADLTHLWVMLDAYESDLTWLRYGQDVEFTTEAYPGETFHGRIAFIDPILNETTRTVKVRVNVDNSDSRLKPEMFVRAVVRSQVAAGGRVLDPALAGKWISPMHPEIVKDQPGTCDICGMPLVRAESLGYVTAEPKESAKPLVVPTSAVLLTGTRAIVYVQVPGAEKPTYEGREIVVGPRAGDFYLVKSGLSEGDLVVTNGNFKLDSALQIAAKPSMMTPQGGGGGGHHHGGMKESGGETMSAMSGHAAHLPPKSKQEIQAVLDAYGSIRSAIAESELPTIRQSFAEFGNRVTDVSAKPMQGDAGAMWQEISMLLHNDSIEGADVASLEEADRVYQLTRQHIDQLSTQFGFPSPSAEPEIPVPAGLDVPDDVAKQIDSLLPLYFQLADALASDENKAATSVAAQLHDRVGAWEIVSQESEAGKLWNAEKRDLSEIIARLNKAADIDAMRSAFALLSESMISIERTFGSSAQQKLYLLHCPMAFDGRGASWLQTDDAVRNPYYGASMLKCADKVEQLQPKPKSTH